MSRITTANPNRRPRLHALPLGLFTLLSLILTWPLLPRLFTHVPGVAQWAFDESTFVWNIWYLKHALIDTLSSPLHTELIYYPLGIDLVLYTYNFFHALLAQPLYLALNLPFASNVVLLSSWVFSGYGAFLLVRWLLKEERLEIEDWVPSHLGNTWRERVTNLQSSIFHPSFTAALVAGLLFAFSTNRAVYAALGHYDMVTTQWIPFYALTLLRSLDGSRTGRQRRKSAVLAGVFFAFNGLAEMITAVFLAMFTLIVIVIWLTQRRPLPSPPPMGEGAVDGGGNDASSLRGTDSVNESTAPPPAGGRLGGGPNAADETSLRIPPRDGLPVLILQSLLITGGVAFLLWSPILVPILRQFLIQDFSLQGWGDALILSADLRGWFTPSTLHPIFGGDLLTELRAIRLRVLVPDGAAQAVGFRDFNTVFLGWATLALALVGALAFWRRVRLWVWTSVIFGLFTLGPLLQINGQYRFDLDGIEATFPLPYALLHYLPIIRANRAPNRNSVVLMLGLAVLVGYGVYYLLRIAYRWWERRRSRPTNQAISNKQQALPTALASIFAALLIFEHLTLPFPLSDARVPEVYELIAAEAEGETAVLNVPLGWRNSFGILGNGPERTRLQYFQTVHGQPMLGGNISRAPDFKWDYFARIPLFDAFIAIQRDGEISEEQLAAAQAQADELMLLYDIGYVILHPPIEQRPPYSDHWQAAWDFARDVLPLEDEPFWTGDGPEGEIEAYRVVQPPGDDSFALDFGAPGTFPYRGEGWDDAETDVIYEVPSIWATARESRLFVPLRDIDAEAIYRVSARFNPLYTPPAESKVPSVFLVVNDSERVGDTTSTRPEWDTLEWQIPGGVLIDGLNRFTLQWTWLSRPCDLNPTSCQIGDTGVEMPLGVTMNGFAEGGFISLYPEDGEEINGSFGREGVNVTVLNRDGEIVEMTGFDTTANEFESADLADFVAEIDTGRIVLVTTFGDATAFLTDDAVAQLHTLGADVSVDGLAGNFFSIIGVKGAAVGQALDEVHPNGAYLELRPDRRALTAAVESVEIRKIED